jgi:PhnB protein
MDTQAPSGYTTVAPCIVTPDTGRLLDFVATAFGGDELARVPLEDGSIGHAEIRVGDTVLLAFDQRPGWPGMPSLVRVFVDDADATMSGAVAAGARVVTESGAQAFGQRGGRVRGPFGNIWWISAVVEDVAPRGGNATPGRAGLCRCDARRTGNPRPRAQRPRAGHREPARHPVESKYERNQHFGVRLVAGVVRCERGRHQPFLDRCAVGEIRAQDYERDQPEEVRGERRAEET